MAGSLLTAALLVTVCALTCADFVSAASLSTTTDTAHGLALTPPSDTLPARNISTVAVEVGIDDDDDDDEPDFSAQTFVTILVTLMIILTNCIIIIVAAWTEAFDNFNKIFIYSLTLADLLIGIFITPYSIFLSVYRKWVFSSEMFCSVEAYAFTVLIMAKLYSLTWLNVDHYVAVRKPERYDMMMSPARSLCWISFSWVVAISFCCPLVFSFESARFSEATFVCMVDSNQKLAYMLTSCVLASFPSILALAVTNAYLFTTAFKQRIEFYEKVFVELSSRPRNYHMTFVMCAIFVLVWLPFLIIFLVKKVAETDASNAVKFYFFWLGVSSSCVQFVVLLLMSPNFRHELYDLCQFPGWCSLFDVSPNLEAIDVNIIRIPKKQ